jgi:hypothetical protein
LTFCCLQWWMECTDTWVWTFCCVQWWIECTDTWSWHSAACSGGLSVRSHGLGRIFLKFRWPRISVQFLLLANVTHFCNVFIYFTSLHVSSNPMLIIRRINCINTSSGMCRCVGDCLVCLCLRTGIPDSHLHRVIYTRWCIDTINSPYDEHWVARNM